MFGGVLVEVRSKYPKYLTYLQGSVITGTQGDSSRPESPLSQNDLSKNSPVLPRFSPVSCNTGPRRQAPITPSGQIQVAIGSTGNAHCATRLREVPNPAKSGIRLSGG